MRSFRLITVLGLTALLAACGGPEVSNIGSDGSGNGNGNGGGEPTPTPEAEGTFSMSATTVETSIDVGRTGTINFTITPAGGFLGDVMVDIAPNGAGIASDAPVTVTVADATPVNGSITLNTMDISNVFPGAYTDLVLTANAGSTSAETVWAMTINPRVNLRIKAGTLARDDETNAYGADEVAGLTLHLGKTPAGADNTTLIVEWTNDDTTYHTIHTNGGGGEGFGHSNTNVSQAMSGDPTCGNGCDADAAPNATKVYTITPTLDATGVREFTAADFYCHNHGNGSHGGRLIFRQ